MSIVRRNFIVDIILLISGLCCAISGFMFQFRIFGFLNAKELVDFHLWSSYIVMFSGLLHLFLHFSWLKNSFKGILKQKI